MKKRLKHLLIIVLLIVVAAALWMGGGSDDQSTLYRTAQITRGDIAEVVTANGTLNPVEIVNVGAQVSGQLKQIYVKQNDEVKKGQLLAEIDPAILQAEYNQRQAAVETQRTALDLSARDLERTRELVKKDYLAKVELERAEQTYLSNKNSYDSIQYELEQAKLNLSYTKITSPIDGVIISQEITQGQTLASNFSAPNLFKIAGDLTKMQIDVNFAEADISKVKPALPVTFTVDAFPDDTFEGVVEVVNLNPNNQSGVVTYNVTVKFNNTDKKLLPGMTAFVRVILSERTDILRVPAAALRFIPPVTQVSGLTRLLQFGGGGQRRGGGQNNPTHPNETKQMLYLLKDGAPVATPITVGTTDETFVEVEGDQIKEGDTVITGLMPRRPK